MNSVFKSCLSVSCFPVSSCSSRPCKGLMPLVWRLLSFSRTTWDPRLERRPYRKECLSAWNLQSLACIFLFSCRIVYHKIVAMWHLAGFRCGTWQAMVDTDIGISRPFYTLFRSSLDLFLCLGFMRKIRRRAYELYMSGALDGSPGASWKEARGDCPAAR